MIIEVLRETKFPRKAIIAALLVLATGHGSANGGWVIERDDRGKSPLLKERKSIAQSPEQKEQQQLARAYTNAVKQEKQKIREQWANPEVSSKSRWVAYSKDYKVKRAVDFEYNRIEVSLAGTYNGSRLDFAAMSAQVRGEVENILATSVQHAVKQDPIQRAIDSAYASLGKDAPVQDAGNDLVLKELFASSNPSSRAIKNKAAELVRNASIRYQVLSASLAAVSVNPGKKLTYVVPLPDSRLRKKVLEYRPQVHKNAKRFALSEDVVMAIMHTESHFNPLARSHIPAFGLMQIVPSTAGRDATRKLYQKSKLLSANYLYNPSKNIEVGSAYLHVLYYQYLKDIKNPESRLYYTIAAYNAGASNIARAFVGKASFKDAVNTINAMSPQQVLDRLVKQAPHRETREYISKVLKRRNYYARM